MNSIDRAPESGQRQSQFPWLALAGVTALLLFSVFSIWQARNAGKQLDEARARLARETLTRATLETDIAEAQRRRKIVSDPATVHVTLQAKSAPALHVFWNDGLGVLIYGEHIPFPADGHSFKLLVLPTKNSVRPLVAATFRPDSNGSALVVLSVPPVAIHTIASIAVSEYPTSANSKTGPDAVWVGNVPR